MSATGRTIIVSLLLIALGLWIFHYRSTAYDLPMVPESTRESWVIEAKIIFQGENKKLTRVAFHLPLHSPRYTIVDEQFIAEDYDLNIRNVQRSNNRIALWQRGHAKGEQVLLYRAIVESNPEYSEPSEELVAESKLKGLRSKEDAVPLDIISSGRFSRSGLKLISRLRKVSKDTPEFVKALAEEFRKKDVPELVEMRKQLQGMPPDEALFRHLLHLADIPTRHMHGVELGENLFALSFVRWAEVFYKGQWLSLERILGKEENSALFPWWHGVKPVVVVDGGSKPDVQVFARRHYESSLSQKLRKGKTPVSHWFQLALFSLPVETQQTLEILFLMPLGALVVVFFRQMIGVPTFGTFMPVLVALAFREMPLLWGALLFAGVIGIGLVVRMGLEWLHLLSVPRLAAILTVVILSIAFFSIFSRHLGLSATLSVGLLPMVILAVMVERITSSWEEHGVLETLWRICGSIVVAAGCYLILTNRVVGHFVFVFPELLLVVFSLMLLMGRYNYYKLSELFRFRPLVGTRG